MAKPKVSDSIMNTTILAFAVAATPRAPSDWPTHKALIEPFTDCRKFDPNAGRANSASVARTGPSVRWLSFDWSCRFTRCSLGRYVLVLLKTPVRYSACMRKPLLVITPPDGHAALKKAPNPFIPDNIARAKTTCS